jgi:hypothetical protein
VLHIDPDREPDRARRPSESHFARAKWADTGTCFDTAGVAESRKKAYEFEIR